MDLKNFASAIAQIAEEKGIASERVLETIELAIAAAYKKEYGLRGQRIKAKINPKTGELQFWQVKLAVDESMLYSEEELEALKEKFDAAQTKSPEGGGEEEKKVRFNPERHIMLKEAKKLNPKIALGEDVEISIKGGEEDYGRIAAQTAKQVIIQRIKEAERETIYSEYKSKEGEIVSGIVQRIEPGAVFLDIGRAVGILPREEQVPKEFYKAGQRLKVYVLKVEETSKGPTIFLSRAYPKLISKLFELEVPEVAQGSVKIKSIAREAGSRSKIAVVSEADGVDPIGSMVGQRGTRIGAVILELEGEKIDVIEWSEDPKKFIGNSLAPAKILEVKIEPKNRAVAIIPEDQLSLAIGKEGQNVRLAAKLTGWKIDIRSPEQLEEKKKKEKKEKKEKKKIEKTETKKKTEKKEKKEKKIKKETTKKKKA
jgi:N utilization substance protein A